MTRVSDKCSHPPCAPHVIAKGSPDVFLNGLNASRTGDPTTLHCIHVGGMAGVNTVFVNGLCGQKIGDPIDCGSKQVSGSPDTFIG
jgi:uncharacterized Zn-binding protein involved in type VI secretion